MQTKKEHPRSEVQDVLALPFLYYVSKLKKSRSTKAIYWHLFQSSITQNSNSVIRYYIYYIILYYIILFISNRTVVTVICAHNLNSLAQNVNDIIIAGSFKSQLIDYFSGHIVSWEAFGRFMLIRTKWRFWTSWRHFGCTLWRSQLLCSWRNFNFIFLNR